MSFSQMDKIIDTSIIMKKPQIEAGKKMDPKEIDEVAKKFEQSFNSTMLSLLMKEIKFDPTAPDNVASDLPKSMIIENSYSKILDLGIAKYIKDHLLKLQEE